jgi:hypothetical protein
MSKTETELSYHHLPCAYSTLAHEAKMVGAHFVGFVKTHCNSLAEAALHAPYRDRSVVLTTYFAS